MVALFAYSDSREVPLVLIIVRVIENKNVIGQKQRAYKPSILLTVLEGPEHGNIAVLTCFLAEVGAVQEKLFHVCFETDGSVVGIHQVNFQWEVLDLNTVAALSELADASLP